MLRLRPLVLPFTWLVCGMWCMKAPAAEFELVEEVVLGTSVAHEEAGRKGHVDFLVWLGDDRFVYATQGGSIKCYDLIKQEELWSKSLPGTIEQMAGGADAVCIDFRVPGGPVRNIVSASRNR